MQGSNAGEQTRLLREKQGAGAAALPEESQATGRKGETLEDGSGLVGVGDKVRERKAWSRPGAADGGAWEKGPTHGKENRGSRRWSKTVPVDARV